MEVDSSNSGCGADEVIDMNVGGVAYSTTMATLTKYPNSYLAQVFNNTQRRARLPKDRKGRYFIDRDGNLFRFVLDLLRLDRLLLPEGFAERDRLKAELIFFQLYDACGDELISATSNSASGPYDTFQRTSSSSQLQRSTSPTASSSYNGPLNGGGGGMLMGDAGGALQQQLGANTISCSDVDVVPAPPSMTEDRDSGHVTLGYRGTFAFGRDGVADVKFRKLTRILVCGRVSLCRRIFGDTLNESRDPDRGLPSRYTSRFYLKHASLEHAFDMLQEAGFRLLAACASGTSTSSEAKTGGLESDESKWNHYNEFVFCKP